MPSTFDKDLKDSTAYLVYEAKLRLTDDKPRYSMDMVKRRHGILGSFLLSYISDRCAMKGATLTVIEPGNPRLMVLSSVANAGEWEKSMAEPGHTALRHHRHH